MSDKVKLLKDFIEWVDYPVLISISDCVAWTKHGDHYYWVCLDNKSQFEGYSCWAPEGEKEVDGYVVVNLDTQTGCWQTEIFEKVKFVGYEEFFEKYEDCM